MMLSRAAARSAAGVRSAAFARSPKIAVSQVWTRGMAKDNKPQQSPRFATSQNGPAQKASVTPSNDASKTPASEQKPTEPAPQTEQSTTEPAPKEQEPEIDFSKLPDLTQGIPSTLEYEQAKEKAALEQEQQQQQGEGEAATSTGGTGGRRPKGELPASAYVSSTERKRQWYTRIMLALTGAGIVAGTVYLGREWDEEELEKKPEVPNGWSPTLWWQRARARMSGTVSYYQEPAFEKLLPDPDPSFARPYTLCISLEDMLVHSEWTRDHGWRIAKRPGVDYFLHYLSQYYEIVLFTTVPFAIGEPIVRKLDPYRFIMWPLWREATKYKDGEVVKDLSYLNRDLSKVIIIDTNERHVREQPENAIILPKWTGDPKDKDLVSLVPFLEFIHTMNYADVRKVLKSFEGKNIPVEFARREAIARAEHNKMVAAQTGKSKKVSGGGLGWLSSHLGMKPSNMSLMTAPEGEENPQEALAKGKMLQDIARERGLRNYLLLEKEIKENGEKWLKQEQEMQEQAQKEAMKTMQSSFFGWFGQGSEEQKPTTPEKSA